MQGLAGVQEAVSGLFGIGSWGMHGEGTVCTLFPCAASTLPLRGSNGFKGPSAAEASKRCCHKHCSTARLIYMQPRTAISSFLKRILRENGTAGTQKIRIPESLKPSKALSPSSRRSLGFQPCLSNRFAVRSVSTPS